MWYTEGMKCPLAPGCALLLAAALLAVGCSTGSGSAAGTGEADGGTWRVFAGEGATAGTLQYPVAVALDATGNVYVADSRLNSIQKLSPEGAALARLGAAGSGPGQFDRPAAVAIDDQANVY